MLRISSSLQNLRQTLGEQGAVTNPAAPATGWRKQAPTHHSGAKHARSGTGGLLPLVGGGRGRNWSSRQHGVPLLGFGANRKQIITQIGGILKDLECLAVVGD